MMYTRVFLMSDIEINFDEENGCISKLMAQARSVGYMTYQDLIECLSSKGITQQDQIDDIIVLINDMGIVVNDK